MQSKSGRKYFRENKKSLPTVVLSDLLVVTTLLKNTFFNFREEGKTHLEL